MLTAAAEVVERIGRHLPAAPDVEAVAEVVAASLLSVLALEGIEIELADGGADFAPFARGARTGRALPCVLEHGGDRFGELRLWACHDRAAEMRPILELLRPWIAQALGVTLAASRASPSAARQSRRQDVAQASAVLDARLIGTQQVRLLESPKSVDERIAIGAEHWSLTQRQRAVVAGVARGMTNKEIATSLGCAEVTVENHLTTIFRKAGVGGRGPLLVRLMSL